MIEFYKIEESKSSIMFEDFDVIDTVSSASVITYNVNISNFTPNIFHKYYLRLFRIGQAINLTNYKLRFSSSTGIVEHSIEDNKFYNLTDIILDEDNIITISLIKKDLNKDGDAIIQYHSVLTDTNLSPYIISEKPLGNQVDPNPNIEDSREFNLDLKYFKSSISGDYNNTIEITFNKLILKRSYVDSWSNDKDTYKLSNELLYRIYDKTNNVYITHLTTVNYKNNKYSLIIDPEVLYSNTLYTLEFTDLNNNWIGSKYNFDINS